MKIKRYNLILFISILISFATYAKPPSQFTLAEFKSKYDDFKYKFHDDLEKAFGRIAGSQTSVRGVKIRGCYSTKEEAERRAQKLQRMDDTFHVFVGDVGAWLPWDPCADNVESEVFADTALQELMSKYKENNANKDIFYEEDKRDKIKKATEENLKAEEKLKDSENIKIEDPIPEESPEEKECCEEKISYINFFSDPYNYL